MSTSPSPQSEQHPQLSIDIKAHVQYTCRRHVVTLFKEFLAIVEQMAEEHDEAMNKLYAALPPDYQRYVELADHFTEEKEGRIRRAVLQRGNDCDRAISAELDKYQMTLGGERPYDSADTSKD